MSGQETRCCNNTHISHRWWDQKTDIPIAEAWVRWQNIGTNDWRQSLANTSKMNREDEQDKGMCMTDDFKEDINTAGLQHKLRSRQRQKHAKPN